VGELDRHALATEGPTKGLELQDREELKGLEGLELERLAMVGGSEATTTPKGGGAARVWGSQRRLGWARVGIYF
jgi:hypothetical protein